MYHLRYSVNSREDGFSVLEEYLASFPVYRIITTYEEKDDNKHCHSHIQYKETYDPTTNASKVKRTTFFKKMKEKGFIPDKPEASYHELLKKTELENIAYIIKDNDIIYQDGIEPELLEEAQNYSLRVETEKKTPMKHQLQKLWADKNGIPLNKQQLYLFIDTYHIERDYLPPNMSQKLQYAIYILHKTYKDFTPDKKIENQQFYHTFYGELINTNYSSNIDYNIIEPHYNLILSSVVP